MYWSYGAYKLYNQLGNHFVFNNQSGGAAVWLCKGSDGTNCTLFWGACSYGNPDLTPFNSIKLVT